MSHHRALKASGLIAVAAILSLACGGSSGGGGNGGSKGEIDIGVDLPMSGGEASNGVPTLNGVNFAVKQQNDKGGVKGYTIKVTSLDDAVNGKHDPQKGAQNVQQLLASSKVLAMVGPFNSNVAAAEIPVANRDSLSMISPANTNPCLTKQVSQDFGGCQNYAGYDPGSLRPTGTNNYFRVAGTDDHQGPANADNAFNQLKITKVAVGDDAEAYGKGIAQTFIAQFKKLGGQVVLPLQDFDPNTTNDFRTFLRSAQNAGAQGIYFGGTDSNKACIVRSQMKGIFPDTAPFMGGDGIVTVQCLTDAATAAPGMYGTTATKDADQVPDARATIDAFHKQYTGNIDYGGYTIPAYACAQLIMNAIGKAIDANNGSMPTRKQVLEQLSKTSNFGSVLGPVTFDKNGDNSQQIMSLYKSEAVDSTKKYLETTDNKQVGWIFVSAKDYSTT
jgi:branched-chain amino acid transport system substrate-binding protein